MSGGSTICFDPIGGIAGDMAIAALVDAFPELEAVLADALAALGLPPQVEWRLEQDLAGGFRGRRFTVTSPPGEHHSHRSYGDIRAIVARSGLAPAARDRALDIYRRLAEAEAQVHGTDPEAVSFHEVGAWDSIVDVVAAAALIEACGPAQWRCRPLPLGSGSVSTDHGILSVPAPATALLLQGRPVFDDGIPGERVTPTGAAILASLDCGGPGGMEGRLISTGTGFGTRQLPGRPNALRVIALRTPAMRDVAMEDIARLSFEVDDQTPEDVAIASDILRASDGVLDLTSLVVQGKKGRSAIRLEILCRQDRMADVLAACFDQTTTLGIRMETVRRAVLAREHFSLETEKGAIRHKRAHRPNGPTVKAEADDVAAKAGNQRDRQALRRLAGTRPPEGER